jgi:hypothetical protein
LENDMKKILIVCAAALLAIPVLAQVKSSVIKNTADTEVFSIEYGSGVATVTVSGVVSASGGFSGTASSVTGTVNATDIIVADTTPTFASTQLVFTAVAAATPTNLVAGDGVGVRIRINGTNYLLRATLN